MRLWTSILIITLCARPVSTQQPTSPASTALPATDSNARLAVWVDGDKDSVKGRLVSRSAEAITLSIPIKARDAMAQTREQVIPLAKVQRIDVQKPDPVWGGAILGALYVAACTRWWCQQGTSGGKPTATDIWIGAGVGAAAGMAIDASIYRYETIYKRPAAPRALDFRPGFVVTMRF